MDDYHEQRRLAIDIRARGGYVTTRPVASKYLRFVIGEASAREITEAVLVDEATTDDMEVLGRLNSLSSLKIVNARVMGRDLRKIQHVDRLSLINTSLADADMHFLGQCVVKELWIGNSYRSGVQYFRSDFHLSDAALEHVSQLGSLESLTVSGPHFTDDGIRWLRDMHSLRFVRFHDTSVSYDGVALLKAALPECKVEFVPKFEIVDD